MIDCSSRETSMALPFTISRGPSGCPIDVDLVDRSIDGDNAAWEEIVGRYQRLVYGVALALCREPETSADVVQKVFLEFHQRLDEVRNVSSLSAWLVTVTRKKASALFTASTEELQAIERQQSVLPDAPGHAIRNSIAIGSMPAPQTKLRQIFARVVFDVTAGIQGECDSQEILLRAEDIHIQIYRLEGVRSINGHLFQRSQNRSIPDARLGLMHNGKHIDATVSDSLGEFAFVHVVENEPLQLWVDLPFDVRVIAEFKLAATSHAR